MKKPVSKINHITNLSSYNQALIQRWNISILSPAASYEIGQYFKTQASKKCKWTTDEWSRSGTYSSAYGTWRSSCGDWWK